jgi:hypothetical protein
MSKVCSKCGESKPIEAFGKNRTTTDGLAKWCKTCKKETDKQYYIKNREKIKEYRMKNREKRLEQKRKWYKANREKVKAYDKEWVKNNPDKNRHNVALRRAARIQRTPCWLTEDDKVLIKRKYTLAQKKTESTGELWVVDHILPLQGKLVSGLHVPANLRVIKHTTNARKYNKYTPV